MNANFPVFTTPNECQDCYKCVRHCYCKAIRIINARAAVIPERCVSCGECVKVCPAHAKKIRSDLARVKLLLSSGAKVYASVAPSYVGYFKGVKLGQIVNALKKAGFTGVGETAVGAQLVSAETGRFLKTAPPGVYLSSACPASVDFITKYHPEWEDAILPLSSPVMAHAKYLRSIYGEDIHVVFIGPCAAKKNESDRHPEMLDLALTFENVAAWLEEIGASPENMPEEGGSVVPEAAEEGRLYSLEGGMNDTLRAPGTDVRLTAVSGLPNIGRLLSGVDREAVGKAGVKLFLEMLACDGGCVNGPVMPRDGSGVDVLLSTSASSTFGNSLSRKVGIDISLPLPHSKIQDEEPSPEEVVSALEKVGKFSKEDELNCGGCGYNSCREFAKAMINGKAEVNMCLSYLRQISRKTSTALIKYIPASVVIVDKNLQILECNRHFAALCGQDSLLAYDSCGNLNGAFLASLVQFSDLFEAVVANGGETERFNQVYGDKILNISVFSIQQGVTAGAVIQDVTRSELQREQVAEKAREVIRKNVMTVQKIARYLGEHMADTEILLKEVAGTYSDKAKTEEVHHDGDKTE